MRSKLPRIPGKSDATAMPGEDMAPVRNVPLGYQPQPAQFGKFDQCNHNDMSCTINVKIDAIGWLCLARIELLCTGSIRMPCHIAIYKEIDRNQSMKI